MDQFLSSNLMRKFQHYSYTVSYGRPLTRLMINRKRTFVGFGCRIVVKC